MARVARSGCSKIAVIIYSSRSVTCAAKDSARSDCFLYVAMGGPLTGTVRRHHYVQVHREFMALGGFDSGSADGRDEWNQAPQLWTVETMSLAINRCRQPQGGATVNPKSGIHLATHILEGCRKRRRSIIETPADRRIQGSEVERSRRPGSSRPSRGSDCQGMAPEIARL